MREGTSSSMALAFVVWVCTLPFVFVLMVPWRGTEAAIVTALVLLAAIAVACVAICAWTSLAAGHDDSGDRR